MANTEVLKEPRGFIKFIEIVSLLPPRTVTYFCVYPVVQ